MGEGPMMIKRTKFGICDTSRGLFLNRGIFVKAPPGFFQSYPSDFEPLPQGAQKEQLNLKIRTIEAWDPKTGVLPAPVAPKLEVPPPAATPVSATVVSSEQTVVEPVATVADTVQVQDKEEAPQVEEAPKAMSRKKKPANSRSMKIR